MKNYFKKFSIMLMMSLILMLGCSVTAFATDDGGVIGTGNLNNTPENSATVGVTLTAPEKGWKRYDDSRKELNNYGSIYHGTDSSRALCYNKTYTEIYNEGSAIKFNFIGNKIRIISSFSPVRSNNVLVTIDGKDYRYNSHSDIGKNQCIFGEKLNLENKEHTVKIVVDSQASISSDGYRAVDVDAIDIDSSGILKPYNENIESITLDKSTMNLIEGDPDKLTAITTPSAVGVTWTSSDPSIATIEVDPTNGKFIKVNAIKEGTCTITATIADGSNLSASCIINVSKKTEPIPTPDPQPTDSEYITNIAHAKGTNTNNPGGEVTIIFHGTADTTLSVLKTADVKDVWIGDNFTYTLVITNTGTKTAKAVVVNDPAPNHIYFNVSGVTTTQGTVDSSSTSKNIIVNVGDILPGGTVTIKIPSTVIA